PGDNLRRRAREWAWRYGPAEAVAWLCVTLVPVVVFRWTHSRVGAAFAGSATEATAYYAVMWIRERHHSVRNRAARLLAEFLPPGTVDACIVRPYLLYTMPLRIGNFGIGILVGKLLADVSFYAMTISMYEITKRLPTFRQV